MVTRAKIERVLRKAMLDLCLEEYSFQVSTKIPSILIEVVSDLTHYLQPHVWRRIKSGYTDDQVGQKVGLEEGGAECHTRRNEK